MKNPIETQRLLLRQWKASDRKPFAALNADPEVMEFFPAILSESESDAAVDRYSAKIAEDGWGFWAVEVKATAEFIGMVGISVPRATLPFSPCVEIGWRLAQAHWGQGYATEAAKAAIQFAFEKLTIDELVSFTSVVNQRSQAVMKSLGMRDTGQNFMHPGVPAGHDLQEHVLFKLTRGEWARR